MDYNNSITNNNNLHNLNLIFEEEMNAPDSIYNLHTYNTNIVTDENNLVSSYTTLNDVQMFDESNLNNIQIVQPEFIESNMFNLMNIPIREDEYFTIPVNSNLNINDYESISTYEQKQQGESNIQQFTNEDKKIIDEIKKDLIYTASSIQQQEKLNQPLASTIKILPKNISNKRSLESIDMTNKRMMTMNNEKEDPMFSSIVNEIVLILPEIKDMEIFDLNNFEVNEGCSSQTQTVIIENMLEALAINIPTTDRTFSLILQRNISVIECLRIREKEKDFVVFRNPMNRSSFNTTTTEEGENIHILGTNVARIAVIAYDLVHINLWLHNLAFKKENCIMLNSEDKYQLRIIPQYIYSLIYKLSFYNENRLPSIHQMRNPSRNSWRVWLNSIETLDGLDKIYPNVFYLQSSYIKKIFYHILNNISYVTPPRGSINRKKEKVQSTYSHTNEQLPVSSRNSLMNKVKESTTKVKESTTIRSLEISIPEDSQKKKEDSSYSDFTLNSSCTDDIDEETSLFNRLYNISMRAEDMKDSEGNYIKCIKSKNPKSLTVYVTKKQMQYGGLKNNILTAIFYDMNNTIHRLSSISKDIKQELNNRFPIRLYYNFTISPFLFPFLRKSEILSKAREKEIYDLNNIMRKSCYRLINYWIDKVELIGISSFTHWLENAKLDSANELLDSNYCQQLSEYISNQSRYISQIVGSRKKTEEWLNEEIVLMKGKNKTEYLQHLLNKDKFDNYEIESTEELETISTLQEPRNKDVILHLHNMMQNNIHISTIPISYDLYYERFQRNLDSTNNSIAAKKIDSEIEQVNQIGDVSDVINLIPHQRIISSIYELFPYYLAIDWSIHMLSSLHMRATENNVYLDLKIDISSSQFGYIKIIGDALEHIFIYHKNIGSNLSARCPLSKTQLQEKNTIEFIQQKIDSLILPMTVVKKEIAPKIYALLTYFSKKTKSHNEEKSCSSCFKRKNNQSTTIC